MNRPEIAALERSPTGPKLRSPRHNPAIKPEVLAPSLLSHSEVGISNRLARPSAGLACRVGDLILQIHPLGSASTAEIARAEGLDITFTVDGRNGLLRLPWTLVNQAMARVEADLPPTELDADTLALVLELALAPLLDSLEAATGNSISLQQADCHPPRHKRLIAIALSLRTPPAPDQTAIAFLTPKDAETLASAYDGVPSMRRNWNSLPVPLAVRLGQTQLRAGELASLQPRDIVLLDETAIPKQRVLVVVGEHRCFFGTLEGSRVTLSDPTGLPATSAWEQGAMTKVEEKSNDEVQTRDSEFEGLPITLQFELGRKQIRLGELRGIASGYTFDLGRSIDDPVDIYANGSLIGCGEFVRISESLGIRITRLFNHE